MTSKQARDLIQTVPHWYHRIEVFPGVVTPGISDSPAMLRALDLPADLTGCRVLDLGTRDGFFAFECERRGASEVVALDYMPPQGTGFPVASRLLASRVPYVQDNLYNLTPEKYGRFDVVLFLGVLYHLPDPMGALHLLRKVSTRLLFLETLVIDEYLLLSGGRRASIEQISPELAGVPLMQFFPGAMCNNDVTNYWGPNVRCVEAMLQENNFRVISHQRRGDRAVFRCEVAQDEWLEYHNQMARGLPAK